MLQCTAMQRFECRLLTAAVCIRSVLELVALKPWYAMTGSQVQGTSSPMKSRYHMHQHCKKQAHFDKKRFWQIDRFTVNGHGMARHIVVKWHRLDSPLYCVLFGHFLTPVMQFSEAFELNDVSAWAPLNSVKC